MGSQSDFSLEQVFADANVVDIHDRDFWHEKTRSQLDDKHERRFARLFDVRLRKSGFSANPWDAAATDPSWPLHVPPASAVGETVDVAGIIAELRIIRAQLGPVNGIEELIADMEWTLDFLSNPENPAHVSLERARHLAHIHHLGSNFRVKRSRMSEADIKIPIQREVARVPLVKDYGDAPTTYAFTIGEAAKTRRRQICDTLLSNLFGEDIEQPYISSVGSLKQLMASGTWFVSFDFTAWYYQFSWADTIAAMYTLWISDNIVVELTKLQMGHYAACKAGHSTTKALSFIARHPRMGYTYGPLAEDIADDVIIDTIPT